MKRFVLVMTVWAMGLAGVLAGVVFPSSASAAAPTGQGAYGSLAPARLLDTRIGVGAVKAAVAPNGTVSLLVAGQGGVPATGVSAVALNVTVAHPAKAGFITVFGAGKARPGVSNLNFLPGQIVSNLVIAPVGVGGRVNLFNGSAGGTFLIADVTGYYLSGAPTNDGAFGSVAPVRMLDTRTGQGTVGAVKAQVPSNGTVDLQIVNRGGVPAGVSAVVLNVTATGSTSNGAITVFGSGTTRPGTSNVNFAAGQTVPNLVIAPVGADGKVSLFNNSLGSTSVIADAFGYFKGGAPVTTGAYGSVVPERLLDTRDGTGISGNLAAAVAANGSVNLKVTGGLVPANASAVVLNVTATQPAQAGFITVFAADAAKPLASNLNFLANKTVPNLVIAPVGARGEVTLFNGSAGATHLLADVSGYFLNDNVAPPVAAVDTTTTLAVSTPSGEAPASPTLTATVTGAGAAGDVEFFNGATSLGTSPVADGVATKALSAIPVGSYSYTAKFIPTDAEAFTPSTSTAVAYVVTAPVDVTAPAPVTGLWADPVSSTHTSVALRWVNPVDADFTGVMIRRADGPTAPASATAGTLVSDLTDLPGQHVPYIVDIGAVEWVPAPGCGCWEIVPGTAPMAGTQYSYALFAHDGANNYAAAANVTYTTTTPDLGAAPTAVLSIVADGEWFDFDASGSGAAMPKTLATGTLDYGDETVEQLSDEFGWFSSHSYTAAGDYEVTLTVIDSAGVSATTTQTVTVTPGAVAPTATITGPTGPVSVGTPVEFTLTTTGPAVASWNVQDEDGIFDGSGIGVAPATVSRTYTVAGTYNVVFSFINAAGGSAETSMEVTVIP